MTVLLCSSEGIDDLPEDTRRLDPWVRPFEKEGLEVYPAVHEDDEGEVLVLAEDAWCQMLPRVKIVVRRPPPGQADSDPRFARNASHSSSSASGYPPCTTKALL